MYVHYAEAMLFVVVVVAFFFFFLLFKITISDIHVQFSCYLTILTVLSMVFCLCMYYPVLWLLLTSLRDDTHSGLENKPLWSLKLVLEGIACVTCVRYNPAGVCEVKCLIADTNKQCIFFTFLDLTRLISKDDQFYQF